MAEEQNSKEKKIIETLLEGLLNRKLARLGSLISKVRGEISSHDIGLMYYTLMGQFYKIVRNLGGDIERYSEIFKEKTQNLIKYMEG